MTNTVEPESEPFVLELWLERVCMEDPVTLVRQLSEHYEARLSAVEAENEKLREALEKIQKVPSQRHTSGHTFACSWCDGSAEIARNALTKGKDDG